MSDFVWDGKTRVWWLTSCSSTSAPTVAEINAGVDLTQKVTKGGIKGFGVTNNTVPADNISTTFAGKRPGTWSTDPTLEVLDDDGTDTVWNALGTRDTAGFLVIRKGVAYTTAVAAAQKVSVHPLSTMTAVENDSGENTRVLTTYAFAAATEPKFRVAVAA